MTSSRDAKVKLAKKLIALSRSSNPNEAARAREEALQVMRRHSITPEEVTEVEISFEPVGQTFEREREHVELANVIAKAKNCRVRAGKRRAGQGSPLNLGFQGIKLDAQGACELYRRLSDEVDARAQALPPHFPTYALPHWQSCFWQGFLKAIETRLCGARDVRAQPRGESVYESSAVLAERVLLPEAEDLATHLRLDGEDAVREAVDDVQMSGYEQGWATGMTANLDESAALRREREERRRIMESLLLTA